MDTKKTFSISKTGFFLLFVIMFLCFLSPSHTVFGQATTVSCNEEKLVFLTKISDVAYYNLEIPQDGLYRFRVSSTSCKVILILADEDENIYDIIDQSTKIKGTYITTTIHSMEAGSYLVGLSVSRVSKANLLVEPLKELNEGETSTNSLSKEDICTGYMFVPTETKQYQFYYTSNRTADTATIKLYNQEEKEIKKARKENFYDWNGELHLLHVKLQQGKPYYLIINGTPSGKNPQEEITVSEWLDKNGTVLEEGQGVYENIANYYERHFYQFTPSESGSYFFHFTTETDHYPSFSIYNQQETRITKKTLKLYQYTDDATLFKRQATLKLKAGQTYYICVRLQGYNTGFYRFKVNKLSPVKKITIMHKPAKKQYINDLDDDFDLSGTVLNIRYKNGRNAKWIYDDGVYYKNACKIGCSTTREGDEMITTFTFRSKSVQLKIPVVKVQNAYQAVESLSVGNSSKINLKNQSWSFVKFSPPASTLYSFQSAVPNSNAYRFVIFDQDGNMVKSKESTTVREHEKYHEELSALKGLEQGKDYYIGAKYWSTEAKGVLTITPVDVTPKTVSNVNVAIEGTEAVVSFDKIENVDGYQIVYYEEQKPDNKTKALTIYHKGNYIYDLKSGKNYCFKVRAYREEGGRKYFGTCSPVQTLIMQN